MTYGAVLAVRCPWAKEKCLALQQSSKQVHASSIQQGSHH